MAAIRRQPFRTDIQGLRAVAVTFVVLYHAGLPWLSGGYVGVDIFFVISGFLITNHLLTSLLVSGRVSFASFYAKRARRILPASLLVLVLTIVAALIWMAPLQLKSLFQDAIATALYVPNVLFAYTGTDYLADQTPSLFQHYWSLGIEEQFYLAWPAILTFGFVACRRSARALFWGVVGLVTLSLVACLVLTSTSQPWAFFSLPTRGWELGVGGLVAFAVQARRWTPRPIVASVGSWAGLVALFAVGFSYSDATLFPGIAALGPVVATGMVIYFGNRPTRFGASTFLSHRWVVFIGAISYSLYLVHWPALVIPEQAAGMQRELPLWLTLSIAVVCVPVAWLLYRFVERPSQRWAPLEGKRPRRTLLAAVAASAFVVASAGAGISSVGQMQMYMGKDAVTAVANTSPVFTGYVPMNLDPTLRKAADSNPVIYANGCHLGETATSPKGCTFGNNLNAPLVELFGDSHAAQWFPALHSLADDGTIRLRVDTKSSCPSVEIAKRTNGVLYVACDVWRSAVIKDLHVTQPDVIVMGNYAKSAGFAQGPKHVEAWADGLSITIESLPETSQVFVLADTPTMDTIPAVCLSAHLEDALACSTRREHAVSFEINSAELTATSASGATYVDLTDLICSPALCSPINGDVLIYRDGNHITPQFSSLLSEPLAAALLP